MGQALVGYYKWNNPVASSQRRSAHGFPTTSLSDVECCGVFHHTGPKPKVKEDDFEELLSTQGFASRPDKKGPRTIAEMRREEMTKEIDPLKLQVTDLEYLILNMQAV